MDPHAFVSVRGTFQKGSGTFAIRPQHVLGKHWSSWFVSGAILSVEVLVERTFYATTDGFGFIEHIGSKHIFLSICRQLIEIKAFVSFLLTSM